MKEFKYTIDGQEYTVQIEGVEGNIASLNVNGEAFKVEMEKEAEQAEGETASAANVNTANALKAPLPGVVTEIKVAVGDEVKVGDTVIVLEAMKMANNLEAEKDGKVTAICVKQGESVLEDSPLVVIE